MISFADTKANISLTVQSILISIGLGTSLLAKTFEHVKELNSTCITLIFYSILNLFILTSVVGIIQSILVYKARGPLDETEQKRKGLLYFGHIARHKKFSDYFLKINDLGEEVMLEEYARQTYYLSSIAKRKMKFVNRSIFFLMINICLMILLIFLSGYIRTR